jgi:hypothetical protein
MQRVNLAAFAGLLLPLTVFLPYLRGQDPSSQGVAAATAKVCPDSHGWTGKYTNYSYGFSIMIPDRLKGFWNSPACVSNPERCVCMSDHGRIIPLTPEHYEAERQIEAYAGHAVDFDEPTVAQYVDRRLGWIRQGSHLRRVEIRRRSDIRLAGRQAQRVVVRYYDEELKSWFIEDFIEALRDGIEYSVYLRTKDKSYTHDRVLFEAVVSSFVFTYE